jgi:hypothetical protein
MNKSILIFIFIFIFTFIGIKKSIGQVHGGPGGGGPGKESNDQTVCLELGVSVKQDIYELLKLEHIVFKNNKQFIDYVNEETIRVISNQLNTTQRGSKRHCQLQATNKEPILAKKIELLKNISRNLKMVDEMKAELI